MANNTDKNGMKYLLILSSLLMFPPQTGAQTTGSHPPITEPTKLSPEGMKSDIDVNRYFEKNINLLVTSMKAADLNCADSPKILKSTDNIIDVVKNLTLHESTEKSENLPGCDEKIDKYLGCFIKSKEVNSSLKALLGNDLLFDKYMNEKYKLGDKESRQMYKFLSRLKAPEVKDSSDK